MRSLHFDLLKWFFFCLHELNGEKERARENRKTKGSKHEINFRTRTKFDLTMWQQPWAMSYICISIEKLNNIIFTEIAWHMLCSVYSACRKREFILCIRWKEEKWKIGINIWNDIGAEERWRQLLFSINRDYFMNLHALFNVHNNRNGMDMVMVIWCCKTAFVQFSSKSNWEIFWTTSLFVYVAGMTYTRKWNCQPEPEVKKTYLKRAKICEVCQCELWNQNEWEKCVKSSQNHLNWIGAKICGWEKNQVMKMREISSKYFNLTSKKRFCVHPFEELTTEQMMVAALIFQNSFSKLIVKVSGGWRLW